MIVFVLYFSGIPIAYALFGASIFYFTFFDAGMPPDLVLQKFITATASFPLLAIPFFVMAGSVMNYSGISKKLMQMAEVLTGHMIGGLAQVNVVLSTMMGGVSGSAAKYATPTIGAFTVPGCAAGSGVVEALAVAAGAGAC